LAFGRIRVSLADEKPFRALGLKDFFRDGQVFAQIGHNFLADKIHDADDNQHGNKDRKDDAMDADAGREHGNQFTGFHQPRDGYHDRNEHHYRNELVKDNGQPNQIIPGNEDEYFLLGDFYEIADIGEEVNHDI